MRGEVRIERATVEDAPQILALQKAAYRSEAEIYDDFTIPPLVQTLEEVEEEFRDHVFLKATVDGRITGSVRAREEGETCFIGKLVVSPELQGRGLGTALMREVESIFPDAARFELFTGHRSERNLRLYRHLGYHRYRTERVNDRLTMVFMQKTGLPSNSTGKT